MPESILKFLIRKTEWSRDDAYNEVVENGIMVWPSRCSMDNEVVDAWKRMIERGETRRAAIIAELLVITNSIAARKDEVSQRKYYDCFPVIEIDLSSSLKIGLFSRYIRMRRDNWYGYVTLAGKNTCILRISPGRDRTTAKQRAQAWMEHFGEIYGVPLLVDTNGDSLIRKPEPE